MMASGKEPILEHIDPVCGARVNPEKTKYSARVGEEIYYFCSGECQKRFEADPEKYSDSDNGQDE